MPAALTLRLVPDRPARPDTRQLHGLACALFENSTDHRAQRKPFTVWPVAPDPVDPDTGLLLRASWLAEEPLPFDPDRLTEVRFGSRRCPVAAADVVRTSRARLATTAPASTAELTFRSPAYFAANGRRTVTPDLRLVLGGYRRRWNEHLPTGSPLHLDDELGRELHRAVELTGYDLRTVRRDGGHGHPVTGFTGHMALALTPDAPTELRAAFTALLSFAPYSGTGARTTHGFGATTATLHRPASPA
ncbi:CRISPR system precrRNA processing endoribonuclease RAMP protein Cas6 [Actinomadura craniellae]|nr:CRISPR system precrRNA processing endoribonuclease RAMP protein Cas6 [Actinomadura craniellae]